MTSGATGSNERRIPCSQTTSFSRKLSPFSSKDHASVAPPVEVRLHREWLPNVWRRDMTIAHDGFDAPSRIPGSSTHDLVSGHGEQNEPAPWPIRVSDCSSHLLRSWTMTQRKVVRFNCLIFIPVSKMTIFAKQMESRFPGGLWQASSGNRMM